jgi:hypothetical protein
VSNDANNLDAQLRSLLAENRKIEALERGEAMPTTTPGDSALEREIVSLMEGGKKIEAIKLYREQTGTGLKEAKDAVESIAAERHIMPSKSGCLGVVLLLMLISVAAMVFGGQKTRRPAPADIPAASLTDARAAIKSKQFVDLTHAFEPRIPHWPGFPCPLAASETP